MFFDINCKNTINKSGVVFDDYFYVSNYEELQSKIKNDDFIKSLNFQKQWNIQALDQKQNLINDFYKIIKTGLAK